MNKKAPSPMPNDWLFLLLVALGAFAFGFALSLLASCTTTRVVEHHTTHTDTLRLVQRDILRELRTVRDSVFLHDSVYFEGATLGKGDRRTCQVGKTTSVWRSHGDSLRASTHSTESHKEKTTTVPWWYDWRLWALLCSVMSFGLIGYALKRRI